MEDDPTLSLQYASQAQKLAKQIDFKRGIPLVEACHEKAVGMINYQKGDYFKAKIHWDRSLALYDSIGDRQGSANMLGNIGSIYYNGGDFATALEYDLKTLRIAESAHDTLRILTCYTNIAVIYMLKKASFPKALEYLEKALPIAQKVNDTEALGNVLLNIGEIYFGMGKLDTALQILERSLVVLNDSKQIPYVLITIGKVYADRGEYAKALYQHKLAYDFSKRIDSKSDVTNSLLNMAKANLMLGNSELSLQYFLEAEKIAETIDEDLQLKDAYEGLAKTYATLSNYKKAYEYQGLLLSLKDTIFNLNTEKKLGTLQFTFDIEKKESQISLLTKDQEIKAQEIKRQKLVRNGFIGGFAVVLLFAGIFFSQRNRISKEKKRSDELLLNILPEETAEELKATGSAKAKSFDSVTVMFTDFKNFTQASEILSAEELVAEINRCYSAFDSIITKHGLEKIKTIGDSYMCAGGLPVSNTSHPLDMVNASLEILSFIEENKKKRIDAGLPYFELRLGIHTGPVVAGVVGSKKFAYDIWGDTVNTASRMESSGEVGKVNISESTYSLIKENFICTSRGQIKAKNKGDIAMYFVEGARA